MYSRATKCSIVSPDIIRVVHHHPKLTCIVTTFKIFSFKQLFKTLIKCAASNECIILGTIACLCLRLLSES
jgi:hypothetical protein